MIIAKEVVVMADIITILIIIVVFALAVFYLVKQRKRNKGCAGCPYAEGCSGSASCCTKKDEESEK